MSSTAPFKVQATLFLPLAMVNSLSHLNSLQDMCIQYWVAIIEAMYAGV